jgi:hypothetical protein
MFKSFFPEWEEEVSAKWLEEDPYTARMNAIKAEREAKNNALVKKNTVVIPELASGVTFDIEVLKTSLPEGVPPAEKEKFLSDE